MDADVDPERAWFNVWLSLDHDDDGERDVCILWQDPDRIRGPSSGWEQVSLDRSSDFRDAGDGCSGGPPDTPLADLQVLYPSSTVMSMAVQVMVNEETWTGPSIHVDDAEVLVDDGPYAQGGVALPPRSSWTKSDTTPDTVHGLLGSRAEVYSTSGAPDRPGFSWQPSALSVTFGHNGVPENSVGALVISPTSSVWNPTFGFTDLACDGALATLYAVGDATTPYDLPCDGDWQVDHQGRVSQWVLAMEATEVNGTVSYGQFWAA